MISRFSVLTYVFLSATLVGCGGGIGEKSSIGLDTSNTSSNANGSVGIDSANGPVDSNTDQSNSAITSQTGAENSTSSDSDSAANKTFSNNVACAGSTEDIQNSMLLLVNAARSQARMCGTTLFPAVPALSWDDTLETTALNHSLDMSSNNFFSHTGSDGLSVGDRADTAQYDWRAIGENIAAGQPTADIAVSEWLASPGHCENIMSESFRNMAVACVSDTGAQYTHYWTQVFGTRF